MRVVINLKQLGSDLSSRQIARLLRGQILAQVKLGNRILIDFGGVKCVSDGFLDELLAVVVSTQGKDWFRNNITVLNIDISTRNDLLRVIKLRIGS